MGVYRTARRGHAPRSHRDGPAWHRTDDLTVVGKVAEVIEEDRNRPQGTTKVLLGYTVAGDAMHLVVNVEAYEHGFEEPVEVVTVYRPEPPKWWDERTRGGDAG